MASFREKRSGDNTEAHLAKKAKSEEPEETIGADGCENSRLLSLPRELMDLIFSFLPLRDRMRARACKLLSEIEAKSKYEFSTVQLYDKSKYYMEGEIFDFDDKSQYVTFDCISRIANRTATQCFDLTFPGLDIDSLKSSQEYEIFKKLNFEDIDFRFQISAMTDEFVFELSQRCASLTTPTSIFTSKQLHQVYMNILDSSMKIREFEVHWIDNEIRNDFFSLIGISHTDGEKRIDISKRKLEIIKQRFHELVIVDGKIEIHVGIGSRGDLRLKLHDAGKKDQIYEGN